METYLSEQNWGAKLSSILKLRDVSYPRLQTIMNIYQIQGNLVKGGTRKLIQQ